MYIQHMSFKIGRLEGLKKTKTIYMILGKFCLFV